MKRTRVLHVLNWLNYGGGERFLLNLLQNINKEDVECDIMVRNSPNPMIPEFEEIGINIIESPSFPSNIIEHYKFLKDFVINNGKNYDYIHLHANSLVYILPIVLFKRYHKDIKVILHSHSSKSSSKIAPYIHKINKNIMLKNINFKIAVSQSAGKWMFNDTGHEVIYNGINVDKFKFNKESRKKIRKELNVNDDEILLGIVGRLVPVKNHAFTINLLENLNKKEKKQFKLAIVGAGELENELKDLVIEKGLENTVIFTGVIDDIPSVLSGIDIYLQPSFFEGFPFTVIEAQVSNLPVIISNNITKEVKISNKLIQLNLDDFSGWYREILSITNSVNDRENNIVNTSKVDMKKIAKYFENIYLS